MKNLLTSLKIPISFVRDRRLAYLEGKFGIKVLRTFCGLLVEVLNNPNEPTMIKEELTVAFECSLIDGLDPLEKYTEEALEIFNYLVDSGLIIDAKEFGFQGYVFEIVASAIRKHNRASIQNTKNASKTS
jgi:hypothetical protein